MRVLQGTKRSVTLMAAACVALTACGASGPEVPFNPTGTSEDVQAINSAFSSPVFGSFATFSMHFDATLGTAMPVISSSARAFNFRRATSAGELRAAATRNAQRIAALTAANHGSFSGAAAAIPAEAAGVTFGWDGNAYVPTDLTGAPANGVRFLIYAVNPVTFAPVEPLQDVGYVQVTDLSGSSTQAARVIVVSGETTYLDYTVTASATTTGGRVTVVGYVTDGEHRANVNLRSTVNESAGLTLVYSLDVPQRDVSIDLTMSTNGLDPETSVITINLSLSGPNGVVSMAGQFTESGGTLTVRVNGNVYATVTATGVGDPVITGANGQPLSDEDAEALQNLFDMTGEAFISFDAMIMPVGMFLAPPEA